MCIACRDRIKFHYKGDPSVWDRGNELYTANPTLGRVEHCIFEDDNYEIWHLYGAQHAINDELWKRQQERRTGKRYDFYEEFTDEQLLEARKALSELINLGEKALNFNQEMDED